MGNKRVKKTFDKDLIAKNKRKIKNKKRKEREQKMLLKKRMKLQKVKLKEEAIKGTVLEDEVKVEETVTLGESGNYERTIKVEEIVTLEEKPAEEIKAQKQKNYRLIIIGAAAVCVVCLVAGLVIRYQVNKAKYETSVIEAQVYSQTLELSDYAQLQHKKEAIVANAGKGLVQGLVDAAKFIVNGIINRPPEIELTEENTATFATIESCEINPETGKVDVKAITPGLAISDDGYYYLFSEGIWENSIEGKEYVASDQKDTKLTFSVNLNYNSASSRLLNKFTIAVLKDGKYVQISTPQCITNPEAIAKYNPTFINTSSKKGILVDPAKLSGNELDDLGVKHACYNIPVGRILGQTSNAYYPTIYYTYDGRTYAFDGQRIAEYDIVFSTLSAKGITTSAILLCDPTPDSMTLVHPLARSGCTAPYCQFNGYDQDGCEAIAAVASFLANRYSGSGHGTVLNWIIANEINARKEWNYIQYMDTDSYVDEYAKAFRVFYNAILSVSGNSRVYISLDQQWDKNLYSNGGYGAREILDSFNTNLKNGGNIDWGVAYHPYNYPLTEPKAWSNSGKMGSYVVDSPNTPVVSMKNIHVLTDYLQRETFLTDEGDVRHVILSEMGYTSSKGQDLQAASFVYAYKVIEANKYIDSMLFTRETDAAEEVAQGLALGLCSQSGGRKSIYNAFKYVDTQQSAQYTDFALSIIGISSWSEIIRQH